MTHVGDVVAERVFLINRELLKSYANASGDQNPIHQDEAFAKSVGLPDVIAHGMLTMALVAKFVTDWAGGSGAVKEFSARFVKPVIVPAGKEVDLKVSALISEVSDGRVRLDITATSAGVKVLGMSKALVEKK
ncbi:MAG: dehydratase [Actinobacteria bacterium]|nr:dehydratase [Actinomycetota bacterium]MSX28567.1 dehydratase [Actinomycetota bacterium]MSY04241.1 dehydratase [Actinomycetota bacterium]MSY39835.1 dehydratase [Actinomycetota bacterium]MSZ85916.1 dehydratase [Actinomycetota bacterium]